jgi:hypothetical protein
MDVETEKVPNSLAAGIKATGGEGEGEATPHDDRERANRIPIWVVEEDVGDGLPTERTYSHSSLGPPVGYVVMPAGMHADRYADHIRFGMDSPKPGPYSVLVASLSTRRAVEAAVAGEFGLSWRSGESSAPVSPDRADAHLWAADERLEAERDKLRAEVDALMALLVKEEVHHDAATGTYPPTGRWWVVPYDDAFGGDVFEDRDKAVASVWRDACRAVRKAAGLDPIFGSPIPSADGGPDA